MVKGVTFVDPKLHLGEVGYMIASLPPPPPQSTCVPLPTPIQRAIGNLRDPYRLIVAMVPH